MSNQIGEKLTKPIDSYGVNIGSVPYIIMCYGKMKGKFFARGEYSKFQLYNEAKTNCLKKNFEFLVKKGYLIDKIIDGNEKYLLTVKGEYVLVDLAKRRIKREKTAISAGRLRPEDATYDFGW
jgi:hypothetical protein